MASVVQFEDLAAIPEAKFYGISEACVRRWQQEKKLTRFKLGRRVFFSKRELAGMVVVSGGPQATKEEVA